MAVTVRIGVLEPHREFPGAQFAYWLPVPVRLGRREVDVPLARGGAHLEGAFAAGRDRRRRGVADPQPPERGQVQVPAGDRQVKLGERAGTDGRRGGDRRQVADVRPHGIRRAQAPLRPGAHVRVGEHLVDHGGRGLVQPGQQAPAVGERAAGVLVRPLAQQQEQGAAHAALGRAQVGDRRGVAVPGGQRVEVGLRQGVPWPAPGGLLRAHVSDDLLQVGAVDGGVQRTRCRSGSGARRGRRRSS